MSLRPRKRRRSQAFENGVQERTENNNTAVENTTESPTETQGKIEGLTGDPKQDLDIWDAFKEEHYEIIEQLPLSLHRQYVLLKELDGQAQAYNVELLASVLDYIALRRTYAARSKPTHTTGPIQHSPASHSAQAKPFDPSSDPSVSRSPEKTPSTSELPRIDTEMTTLFSPRQPDNDIRFRATPSSIPLTSTSASTAAGPKDTRSLLVRIAQLSEETLKASEEKVNLAQAAYESVDRHIRLFDQAIKEQEASISLGVRAGTHLAPILLPDLVVPRWARPSRIEHSPVPSLSPEDELVPQPTETVVNEPPSDHGPSLGIISSDAPSELPPTRKTPRKKGKKTLDKKVDDSVPLAPRARTIRSLKLRVPAQAPELVVRLPPTVPDDPQEQRYCYCNQVSYDTMVACDNPGCKIEWFHLSCLGLKHAPKGKWFCRDCKPRNIQKGK
ncbi:hypothetical protein SERLADRAFT_417157, partial [Serpula lacrymans var. lacrymans S7.9]